MRTMGFECPIHGYYEIDLEDGQEPPKWCVIYKDGTNKPCGEVLKKKFFVPAVHYKGSGFYTTDK